MFSVAQINAYYEDAKAEFYNNDLGNIPDSTRKAVHEISVEWAIERMNEETRQYLDNKYG